MRKERGAWRIAPEAKSEQPEANRQTPEANRQTPEANRQTPEARFPIADDNLRIFLNTLVKTTKEKTRFIFTSRYLFELDEKRVGTVQELALRDLSRPEALGLMQKLPHLSNSAYEEKLKAFEVFGGHPYALIALDRHCGFSPLAKILQDASAVHAELRRFLAIELNYRRLSERARELLDRLAAFRIPVPVAAAEWVCGTAVRLSELGELSEVFKNLDREKLPPELSGLGEHELLKIFEKFLPETRVAKNLDQPIAELIAWGLLTPILDDGELQALSVHSLVRDFCRDQCCAADKETWRQRLRDAAAFYTNRSQFISQDDKTPAVVWSEMEAFELLMEAGDYERAVNLIMDAHPVLDRWGFGRFLESQYSRLIGKIDQNKDAEILHNIAVLFQTRGDYSTALENYKKALNIKEQLKDRSRISKELHQIGNLHYLRGDYGAALAHYERSLKMLEELGDRGGVASSLHQIGMIHEERGDYGAALAHYERSLKMLEELGDRGGVARSLHQIGVIHQYRGDYGAALAHYERSLKMLEELGDRGGVASSLHQIGMIHEARGDYGAALAHYERSLKIKEELGDRGGVASSRGQMGNLFTQLKRYPEAFQQLLLALTTFVELGSPNAEIAVNALKALRSKWGAKPFDAAWKQATGQKWEG